MVSLFCGPVAQPDNVIKAISTRTVLFIYSLSPTILQNLASIRKQLLPSPGGRGLRGGGGEFVLSEWIRVTQIAHPCHFTFAQG